MNSTSRFARHPIILAAAFGCLLTFGCSPARTTVTGKVSYSGKPVIWGGVLLLGEDDVPIQASIAPDGTYRADGVLIGPVRVGVSSPDPTPPGRIDKETGKLLPSPVDRSKWFTIPDKFSDPRSSGLTYTVDAKNPIVDIELK